jgi:DNA-binding response OmpR family regulator
VDPRWPHRRIRILLVDDEKVFVDTLAKRLKKRGFNISKAYNGSDAIKFLKKSDFDVAVLDIMMGKPNGADVLNVLHGMASIKPVIILTGKGSGETVDEAMAAGAFDCLIKPYELDDLLDKIEAAYFSEREPIE